MSEMRDLEPLLYATPLQIHADVGKKGDLRWIELGRLFVDPTYQRDVLEAGRRNIRRIAEQFNWALFAPLVVAPRAGNKFAVIDGQHRAIAAKQRGDIESLPCLVIDADHQLQAKAFSVINGMITKVSPQIIHRAKAAAGDPDAVRLNEVCARAGVVLLGYPKQDVAVGETMSIGTIGGCLDRFGEEVLVEALETITRTNKGNVGMLREGIISGTCDVLAESPNWRGPKLIEAVEKLGVRKLYERALKAKAESMAGTMSIRKYYGHELRVGLREVLGDGGKAEKLEPKKVGRRHTEKPEIDPRSVRPLDANNIAAKRGHTIFPSTVIEPAKSERLLISGANSVKLGAKVQKGEWAGYPIYQLSLEERATCPATCHNWLSCYGNAMPFARRHKADADLIPVLRRELSDLQMNHPKGFVVRLHVLGDFFSVDYVNAWKSFLKEFPALHVFGYTARKPSTEIGKAIADLAEKRWDRFAVRLSTKDAAPGTAVTIWRKPEAATVKEGTVCPAQTEASACCATCGLCWSKSARNKTIVFVGHGMVGRGSAEPKKADIEAATRNAEIRRIVTQPSVAKRPVPANTKDAVKAFLEKGGQIRKFDTADTGQPWAVVEYLQRKGYKIEPRQNFKYAYRGKLIDLEGLYQLANTERTKEGKQPITAPRRVA